MRRCMGGTVSRRKFLSITLPAVVGAAAVGGAVGYLATPPKIVEKVVEKPVGRKVKAGYIYIGPVGDYGWSYSHDQGRKWADSHMGEGVAESVTQESIPEAEVKGAIESLIEDGVNLIIGTSFGYMDPMAEMAEKYPDVYFVHINGFRAGALGNAPQNMSVADINTYQVYYLEGIAAGAVTQTGSLGIIASHPVPVIVRLVNAFALGARYSYKKRTGKEPKINLVWLLSWFDPGKTRTAAVSLIEGVDADVLSFAEDSPTTLQVAEEYWDKGRKVWSFSHYTDMSSYGPRAHLTGHIVNWGTIYLDFYKMIATNSWTSVDIWAKIGDYLPSKWAKPVEESTLGKFEGAVSVAPVNPAVPEEWLNHMKLRYEQMKEGYFEPFSSEGNLGEPIRDQDGEVRVEKGGRADRTTIMNMDWIVEYIQK